MECPNRTRRKLPIGWIAFWTVFLLNLSSVTSVAIDNDIVGEPDIECLEEEIRFWVKTRKYFAGRIYAKGKADNPACVQADYSRQSTDKPHYDVRFGSCGMKSLRSVDPRGMYYGITVVVSFHPLFITKVDQAFHVKCFFEEANRGLTAELGVSMIPTTEALARHTIPGCSYSIHRSTISDIDAGRGPGQAIKFARVGDKILHQWFCDDPMFGILINNCYVTDGFGQKADVVDNRGCPLDPILITGIRYSQDLMHAYAESHVFKFADKPGVWFFCQIQMCMKAAGMCRGLTPPNCGVVGPGIPGGNGATPNYQVNQGGETFTPFGPSFPPQPTGGPRGSSLNRQNPHGPFGVQKEVEEVTTTYDAEIPIKFEENDVRGVELDRNALLDNNRESESFPTPPDIDLSKITIPPGFGELLRNMPKDVKIDSLNDIQDLFLGRQSDKRFLESSGRRRGNGSPTVSRVEDNTNNRINSIDVEWSNVPLNDDALPNEIAGQLIIFDLDEDPPDAHMTVNNHEFGGVPTIEESGGDDGMNGTSFVSSSRPKRLVSCVISAQGLLVVISLLGGLASLFLFSTCAMCMRMRRANSGKDMGAYEQKGVPYDRYPPKGDRQRSRDPSRHHRR